MKTSPEKIPKEKYEEIKNIETISSEEENSENGDQNDSPKNNIASFITTPYERVLSIINEAKAFILSVSSEQQNLVKGLEWAIKVISSHNLYTYELKDHEENEDFKQFQQFMNSYNDVIPLSKKPSGKKSYLFSSLNLKRNTNKYSIHKIEEEKQNEEGIIDEKESDENKKEKEIKDNNINNNVIDNKNKEEKDKNVNQNNNKAINKKNENKSNNTKSKFYKNNIISKNNNTILRNNGKNKKNNLSKFEKAENAQTQKKEKIINKTSNNFSKLEKNLLDEDNPINIESGVLNKSFSKYSSSLIERALNDIKYPLHRIIEKTFNIFELKEIIGQDNVLPIMGKVILDSFGLYSDDIISTEKLDPFLVSISNQYFKTTLYHNSMHGADVTQSLCLYFLNSNAEEICQSLVLDLLGILISALGHDLSHPGLTNPFHINSSSELAITYNDVSCLENFHASTLFRTIRKPETDIFEKLSVQDYKTIRKRMIGNILATDMVNHGKIMTLIKSRIAINKAENKAKFELLSGNEKTKFEEQQSLFDFLIHAADLAHNTKLFNISLKWVELLSEEFWLQGDKEKSMNLPVSFLCDRDSYNIPQSQVGFIKGFIIPTFDCLVDIFPSLKFTVVNARTNLKKWEKLASKGRLKGWTPEKTKKVDYKKKMKLYGVISSISENANNLNNKVFKRKSGNVNSLSHALQVKEDDKDNKENQSEKSDKKNKEGKNKIHRPNIIMKTKNHDKKVNIHRFNKFK